MCRMQGMSRAKLRPSFCPCATFGVLLFSETTCALVYGLWLIENYFGLFLCAMNQKLLFFFFFENLSFINPHLHANHAICCIGIIERKVNVCPKRMERQRTFAKPFSARDLRSSNAPRQPNTHAFYAAGRYNLLDSPLEHSTIRHAFLQLFGYLFGHDAGG